MATQHNKSMQRLEYNYNQAGMSIHQSLPLRLDEEPTFGAGLGQPRYNRSARLQFESLQGTVTGNKQLQQSCHQRTVQPHCCIADSGHTLPTDTPVNEACARITVRELSCDSASTTLRCMSLSVILQLISCKSVMHENCVDGTRDRNVLLLISTARNVECNAGNRDSPRNFLHARAVHPSSIVSVVTSIARRERERSHTERQVARGEIDMRENQMPEFDR
jgi:hypothetical protein